jgi:hypothetical protein
MYPETLKEKIVVELKLLNDEQIVHFAWLCAVRALPFLGSKGNFDFWSETQRQMHLYAVLYALDANPYDDVNPYNHVAKDAAIASTKAATAARFNDPKTAKAVDAATYAARATLDGKRRKADFKGHRCWNPINFGFALASDRTRFKTQACILAIMSAKAAAKSHNFDIKSKIFDDISLLKNNKEEPLRFCQTIMYGKIWDDFQKALNDEGCAYWGRLYQKIFENGFILDEEALIRRMSVPAEIREKGAAEVASYLEKLDE